MNDTTNSEDPPAELLDGGAHFDDVSGGLRGAKQFINASTTKKTPRDGMMDIVHEGKWERQKRKKRRRTS